MILFSQIPTAYASALCPSQTEWDGKACSKKIGKGFSSSVDSKLNQKKIHVQNIPSHGINRNHDYFKIYSEGQNLLARQILEKITMGKLKHYDSLNEPIHHVNTFVPRHEDIVLKKGIEIEASRAIKLFENLFDIKNNF